LLIYHGRGHFNACFKLARVLAKEFDVIFAGHIYFETYVTSQGFSFYRLTTVPFGLGFEKWINQQENKKFIWWQNVKDRWRDRLYFLREASLTKMLKEISPSHVIIDSWQSTDFIAMYEQLKAKKIKVAFVQTMLSTVVGSLPPLTSEAIPNDNASSQTYLRKFILNKWKHRIFDWLHFLGMDNDTIIDRRIRRNKISAKYITEHPAIFTRTFKNIPEIIFAPIDFEFREFVPLPHQYYVGSLLDEHRIEYTIPEFEKVFSRIKANAPAVPLIYCSFGSTDLEEINDVIAFLKKLIAVMDATRMNCIISTGSKTIIESIRNTSGYVYVFSNVPQLKVLQHTNVLITHGGLNSIKEAIELEIPMLIYPARKHADNFGNAARVEYHGLGIKGNLKRASIENIKIKLRDVLENSIYKENLRKFKEQANEYSDEQLLTLFKSIDDLK